MALLEEEMAHLTWWAVDDHPLQLPDLAIGGMDVVTSMQGHIARWDGVVDESLRDAVTARSGWKVSLFGQEMLFDGVQEAGSISDGEPFELLVQIVADGLQLSDPDRAPQVRLFIDVVSQLRPEHIRLLRVLGTVSDTPALLVLYMAQKWTIYALENRLPELSEAIDPLLARVVSLGLVYQTGSISTDTPGRPGPQPQWGLTKFGLKLMGYLYDRGGDSALE